MILFSVMYHVRLVRVNERHTYRLS